MVVAVEGFGFLILVFHPPGLILLIASCATWGSLFCMPELSEGFGLGFFSVVLFARFFPSRWKQGRRRSKEISEEVFLTAVHMYQSVSLSYC